LIIEQLGISNIFTLNFTDI